MDQEDLNEKLILLMEEHRDLDAAIQQIVDGSSSFDQLHLQRLKKRKLGLKDQISRLKALLVPDIIA